MQILVTTEELCESDPQLRASARSTRALIYHHQNHQEGAKAIWEENLETRRRLQGENHFLVGNNLCNLGAAYGELGDIRLCQEYFEAGQAHREKNHPHKLSDLALFDCNYASYLIHAGKLEEAEMVVSRAISRYKRCESPEGSGYLT